MATIYYQDDQVTLWHGRCEDVLPTIPASTVDLVLTDPPYGTTNLEWDKAPDLAWFWRETYRLCRPAALQVLFSAQPFTTDLIVSNRGNYRYELIWSKPMATRFFQAQQRPLAAHENIQIFAAQFGGSTYNPQKTRCEPRRDHRQSTSGTAAHYSQSTIRTHDTDIKTTRYPKSVLDVSNRDASVGDHPSQKPLELICWLVATYSNPGDLIVDPYGGRGTTAWAAKKLGRRCVIAEAEERYCEVAARGLAQEVMDLAS